MHELARTQAASQPAATVVQSLVTCNLQLSEVMTYIYILTVADIAGLVVEVAFLGDLDGELRLGAGGRGRGVADGLAQAGLAVGGAALREVGHGLATAGRGVHPRILGRGEAADERVHVAAGRRPRFAHNRHRHHRRHQHRHYFGPAVVVLPTRHHHLLRPHPS